MDLYFDILCDVSDELELLDYFQFIIIEDLTWELKYDVIRRVEYCYVVKDLRVRFDKQVFYDHAFNYVLNWCIDLDVAEWLKRNRDDECSYHAIIRYCMNGNLEMLKWANENVLINRSQSITDAAADKAVEYGHLGVIKWMFQNMTVTSHWLFEFACQNGHIDIAEWLLENSDTIPSLQCAMQWAINNGQWHVVRWLGAHPLLKMRSQSSDNRISNQ
jgi:hypothetical protein